MAVLTMQTGTRTLRRVLVALAVLLVAVVAGFIAVAHYKARSWLASLPEKLGANISQQANNFTWDQSSKGRKIFTVHASKEAQAKNGKMDLHDVGITLYGPDGNPTDKIHGADFEFDQKAQVLSAQGEVYIDLAPPPTKSGKQVKSLAPGEEDPRTVHVKTIGLVFGQKEQMATSDGPVEFRMGGYTGTSVGATYDSKNGVVLLRSQVRLSGLRAEGGDQRPVVLTASYAEMDRKTNQVDLQAAKYVSAGDHGTETASAMHAIVHTDSSGEPQEIDADGNVVLTSESSGKGSGTVKSDRAEVMLGDKGQAQTAHLYGSVRYMNADRKKRENGSASDARIAFDAEGRPVHALLTGGVALSEFAPSATRHLESATLDLAMAGGGKAPTVLKAAVASGPQGARLQLVDETAKGKTSTDVKADRLVGRFDAGAKTTELTGFDGTGHTWVQRIALTPAGTESTKDTSMGDTLRADFAPGDKGRSELTRAEQHGNVDTVHEEIAKKGPKKGLPEVEHGRAENGVYEAAANLMHLTGSVEVQDETSALFADRVDVDRNKGDATANGAVKVTYLEAPAPGAPPPATPQEPVHVLAARAIEHKANRSAEFFGDANARARMWQGASQVEAPVMEFYRNDKRLVAHGEPGSDAASVRAVLVSAPGDDAKKKSSSPVRIVSRQMVYTDSARTVEFTGAVRVLDADGTLASNAATVWLTPANGKKASPLQPAQQPAAGLPVSSGLMDGKVDHMTATGSVVIDQPGRKGTGEKLVYTASDGIYVLTGTKSVPPKVVDEAQGMTTGAALRFRQGDDSVEVLGSEDAKKAGRVRSETRMRQ